MKKSVAFCTLTTDFLKRKKSVSFTINTKYLVINATEEVKVLCKLYDTAEETEEETNSWKGIL